MPHTVASSEATFLNVQWLLKFVILFINIINHKKALSRLIEKK